MNPETRDLVLSMRRASGLSLRRLASVAGTSAPTLTDYEKGRKEPRLSTLRRLANATHMELVIELRPKLTFEETRTLEFSKAVAKKVEAEPERIIGDALARLPRLREAHPASRSYYDEWETLLKGSLDVLLDRMVSTDQRAKDLRTSAPWVGVLNDEERREIIERTRRERGAEAIGGG